MTQGLKGFFIIVIFWVVGEAISMLMQNFLPGNVIGMVLMFASLQKGWIREESVSAASEFLAKNMTIMFLPPGVGLMVAYEILGKHWLPITLATILSTMLVLVIVGKMSDKKTK
ncbi:MAG: CidA/LrgA family protein [Marinilabiliaceae bacterium]|nr:CidA/LrgA family protein [Marinilabiliaceae bacterium]